MKFDKITVLLTGAGAPGAPSIIKCLRKNGEREIRIVGIDMKPDAKGKNLVDAFYVTPSAAEDNFIDCVLEICENEDCSVIVPLVTKELEKFSQSKKRFQDIGVEVSVMDYDKLVIANDKGKLLQAIKEAGFPCAGFVMANDVDEVIAGISKMGYPQKPVVLKSTYGNGSRGNRVLDVKVSAYDLLFNEKPGSKYTTYNNLIETLREKDSIPTVMIMEYLPGEEYNIDILANNGDTILAVGRECPYVLNSISMTCVVHQDKAVIDLCKNIIKLLKLDGNIGFDLKANENGEMMIMEINPRLTAGIGTAVVAGCNLPYLRVKQLLGEPLPDIVVKEGVRMERKYTDYYFDSEGNPICF